MHTETAITHKPGKCRDFILKRHPIILFSRGPAKLLDQPRRLVSAANTGRICKKIEGKDLPNVKQLPMQETSSTGILTQGANGKPVEVMGLQLTRPKLPKALDRRPKKTGAGQNGTRAQNLTPATKGS
jgi:hypothetical protein